MALPKKPTRKVKDKVDRFIQDAEATKADNLKPSAKVGRRKGPPKEAKTIFFTVPVAEAIDKYHQGNRSYFVDQAMREYFKNRGISISGEDE